MQGWETPVRRRHRRNPWAALARNLALLVTATALLCAGLAQLEFLGFLTQTVRPLLAGAGVLWGIFVLLRGRSRRRGRGLFVVQGPGHGLLQAASLGGFRQLAEAPPDGPCETAFIRSEQYLRAGRPAEAAVAAQRALDVQPNLAASLNLGVALVATADLTRAEAVLTAGLERAQAVEEDEFAAAFRLGLGAVRLRQGRMGTAVDQYTGALAGFRSAGDPGGQAVARHDLASALAHQGHFAQARRTCNEALKVHQQRGCRLGRANALGLLSFVAAGEERPEEADQLASAALVIHEELANQAGKAQVLTCVGNVRFRAGEFDAALTAYGEVSSLLQEAGDPVGQAGALVNEGNVRFRQGQVDAALAAYGRALEVQRRSGNILGQADTLTNMASVLTRQSRTDEALQALNEARGLYRRLGTRSRGSEAAELLAARLQRRRHPVRPRPR